ncbi:unnamed protein product [Pleuronectes platessa]|uniref:Uncharacterized protein n=1 Tax=Pleuronectes platessa TaxID=8262 RepID=A0A9N7V8H0_PLEPL|nr:unnamed protein product [Pleuronectes platessa]
MVSVTLKEDLQTYGVMPPGPQGEGLCCASWLTSGGVGAFRSKSGSPLDGGDIQSGPMMRIKDCGRWIKEEGRVKKRSEMKKDNDRLTDTTVQGHWPTCQLHCYLMASLVEAGMGEERKTDVEFSIHRALEPMKETAWSSGR